MSWPSNDFELEIQQRLDALERVAVAAMALRLPSAPPVPDFTELDCALQNYVLVRGDDDSTPPSGPDKETP